MSFARNFALGQQIGKGLVDTYQAAKQQREFEDIQKATPEEFSGYTAQDGEQLAAIANAKDPQGNPYYTLEAQPGGQYGIRSNFQVQGADGQMATPADVGIGQRRVANFLGQRYDADQLTPERMEGLRARAMAGAVSKTDPIRGMGLMQSIKSGERDDTRFDWEKQGQPLKQRAAELQIAGAERGERQGVRADNVQTFEDEAMKMPEADVRGALNSYLNTNKSDLPLLVTGSTKGGFMMAERNPETGEIGKSFSVPLAVGRKLVVGQQLAARGMGAEALKYLTGVDDNITGIIDKYNKQTLDTTRVNNDARAKQGNQDNDASRLDILRQELGIKRGSAAATAQYYKDRTSMDRMGAANYFTGQDGNTYASIPTMGKNGLTFETVRVNPEGVKLNKVGGTDMKPADVKEEGTKVTIGGKLQYADGLGGYVPAGANGKPAGVLPSERQAALKKAGVPDNLIDRLEWNKDGTAVGLNGMRFDLKELKNIKGEYERLGKNEIIADEDRKRSLGMHSASNRLRNAPPEPVSTSGFGPTITYRPDPNAPSIYAGPEEWEAYRRFQQSQSE